MGYIPAEPLTKTGQVVLALLHERRRVEYNYFYDGSDERHETLTKELGLDDDWISPELLVDEAVGQLAQAGLIETRDLEAKLADDETDYEIILTSKGREFIASGAIFQCRGLDL